MGETGILEGIVNGRASGYIESNFTVNQGMINTLNAVLSPMTGSLALDVSLSDTLSGLPSASAVEKRFIGLNNVNLAGTAYDTMYCAVSGGTVSLLRLYNASGEYLSLGIPDTTDPTRLKTSYPGGNDFYVYVEYTGTPVLQFSLAQVGVPAGNVVRIDVDVSSILTADMVGNKILCGFDTNTGTGPGAVGIAQIPATGIVSLYLKDPLTGLDWYHPGSGTYYLSALIDMSGYYDTVNFPLTAAQLSSIMPLTGDFMTQDESIAVTFSGTGVQGFALFGSNFTQMTEPQIFAANTVLGNGVGTSPSNATTLPDAFAKAQAIALSQAPTDKPPIICLIGDVTLTESISITFNVGLLSPGTPHTITLGPDSGLSAPYFDMPDNLNTNRTVFFLQNVTVSGGSVTDRQYPAFSVGENRHLQLDEDAAISNIKTKSLLSVPAYGQGGAIRVLGGNLSAYYSSITGCYADQGGAIFVGYGSGETPGNVYLDGATINGNSAYQGGGIFGSIGSQITLEGMTRISANTATDSGGGVYTDGSLYAVGMDTASVPGSPYIVDNTATANPTYDEYYASNTIDTVQHSLYVSQSGTDDGSTELLPTNISVALANADIINVILVSDITVTSTLTIPANRTLYVRSIDSPTPFAFLPGAGLTAPIFAVESMGSLILERVSVGVPAGTSSLSTLISIGADGNLSLAGEATLRNNASSSSGGAVSMTGGTFALVGGSISNCSAANGGAIYAAGSNAIVSLNGGTVTGNNASGSGGALFAASGSMVMLQPSIPASGQGTGSVNITANQASSGGGLYMETGVTFYGVTSPDLDTNYVYGNTPTGSDIVGP